MKQILIIDDDRELSEITSDMLTGYGYEVKRVYSASEAYEILETDKFHLIVLDINLPDATGFEVCEELRRISGVPVIFVSARTSESDKITGLDMGGDDYITKPYSLKELLARINALIRRTYPDERNMPIYKFGSIEVNSGNRMVTKDGNEVHLSLKEYDVLQYLCQNMNQTLTKEQILNNVWNIFTQTELSTVSVHIRWLREKLENNPAKPEFIKTVWGVGYRLEK